MRTYSWMARRLPGVSFTSKITLAGLVIVHVPRLTVVAIALIDPGLSVLSISLMVARWGGDEFLVVCHRPAHDMVEVMDRVRTELDAPHKGREQPGIKVSIGVAELAPAESMADCIARADAALFAAKNQGRDSVRAAYRGH